MIQDTSEEKSLQRGEPFFMSENLSTRTRALCILRWFKWRSYITVNTHISRDTLYKSYDIVSLKVAKSDYRFSRKLKLNNFFPPNNQKYKFICFWFILYFILYIVYHILIHVPCLLTCWRKKKKHSKIKNPLWFMWINSYNPLFFYCRSYLKVKNLSDLYK